MVEHATAEFDTLNSVLAGAKLRQHGPLRGYEWVLPGTLTHVHTYLPTRANYKVVTTTKVFTRMRGASFLVRVWPPVASR